MKPRNTLATAALPDGKTLALIEQDGVYSVSIDGIELMSTRRHASEETLAQLACAHLVKTPRARVLIGGLGFGYTLQAALAILAVSARIVVAEILPEIIAWNRNPAYPLAHKTLEDRRVTVQQTDVVKLLKPATYDAILLDVDNGPAAFTTEDNQSLYSPPGLAQTQRALNPNGIVAYWSAAVDNRFEKRLVAAGFEVETHRARAHKTSGAHHTIYLACYPKRTKGGGYAGTVI